MSPDTLLWLIAVIAFVVLEASTTALASIWFAVGAAAALITSFFTQSLSVEAAVFAVVSAITLIIMVPTLAKRRKERKAPVTNGSPLTIGKQGVVLGTWAVCVWMVWTGRPVPNCPCRRAHPAVSPTWMVPF